MRIDPVTATEILDISAAGVVLLGVVLAATLSLGRSIWLVAIQSALTGVGAIGVGLATGADHLLIGGLLAIGVKGFVVPYVLGSVLRRSSIRRERQPLLSQRASLVVAVVIIFTASLVAGGPLAGFTVASSRALPVAIAEILTGLLIAMTRRKALSIVVGLLVFENGIALIAFSLTYGMPFVVELGVLFDLLIAVVVAWVYARRMIDVMGTTSTDRLKSLRG